MKSTGIVRKIDELGRIVLPIELRRTYDLAVKDAVEIYTDDDKIILKKERNVLLTFWWGRGIIVQGVEKQGDLRFFKPPSLVLYYKALYLQLSLRRCSH